MWVFFFWWGKEGKGKRKQKHLNVVNLSLSLSLFLSLWVIRLSNRSCFKPFFFFYLRITYAVEWITSFDEFFIRFHVTQFWNQPSENEFLFENLIFSEKNFQRVLMLVNISGPLFFSFFLLLYFFFFFGCLKEAAK